MMGLVACFHDERIRPRALLPRDPRLTKEEQSISAQSRRTPGARVPFFFRVDTSFLNDYLTPILGCGDVCGHPGARDISEGRLVGIVPFHAVYQRYRADRRAEVS
jgi:hypothetical protein